MKRQELEEQVTYLETTINDLRKQLVDAKVLRGMYGPFNNSISLTTLRDQINGIKDFLGIEYVVEPPIPGKSMMRKIKDNKRS